MHMQGIDSGRATLSQYFERTIALTGITIWILVALLDSGMSFVLAKGWVAGLLYLLRDREGWEIRMVHW